jgi:hypothetical protein
LLNKAKQLQKIGEKSKKLHTLDLGTAYTPMLSLSHLADSAQYIIILNWDGEIFVDREEDIHGIYEKNGKETNSLFHSQMYLRWNLGQLITRSQ